MARLARSARAPVQEIPDSYEQQQELSLSSSDVEAEDDDSEMIQHQLTQSQQAGEEDEDDDDDGAVNLFLPDIVDIVNKAASTPQKSRMQPNRHSSVLRSSPIAAAKSSPRSRIEVTAAQGTQDTQSSTQSTELGHLKNYLRKKAEAEAQAKAQMGKQKSSPLRRPSSRSKPISRSPTPEEEISQLSQGRADPYDVPSSPEAERRPTPAPQPEAETKTKQAGGKRKRKEAASVQRSETPEETVTSKRPRRGQDKPEYSPSSLRKVGRSSREQSSVQPEQKEQEQPPTKRGRWRPQKAEVQVEQEPELEDREVQEEPPEDEGGDEAHSEEKKVPVVVVPLKRTKSRQAELEADKGQAQPVEDDSAEDDYVPQQQDDEEEEEDGNSQDDDEAEQEGGVSGINSILMNPSPKKVPSQNVAVPQRQRRTEAQRLLDHNLQRAGTSIEASRNASPPSAQPLDDEQSASTRSQRDGSPAAVDEAAEASATTVDFGRNPFEEPTFNFTDRSFSATSKSFLKDMLLDRDVRELFQLTDDLGTQPEGLSRKTPQARDIAQIRRYLVTDYNAMAEQRDAEDQDEGVICDLYSNVFTNTRKLKKKVNDLIDENLSEEPEDLSNGEQAALNKQRKSLLRDVYLFVVPDMLKVTTALIETYCTDRPPGIYCFDELHGLVRLTLELLRTAEDETNAPYCPKQPSGGIDYQYPKHKDLMKKLRGIDMSCKTIEDEQVEYENAKARERAQRREAEEQALESQRKHEAFLRAQEEKKRQQEEEDAAYERNKREKLRAWAEKNASILNRYKDQPIPRQVTQFGYPPLPASQQSSRRESVRSATVEDGPFAQDIRTVQPIMPNGAQAPNPSYQHQLHVLPRRKPIVKATERGNALPSTARKHKLPLSNDDSDDDAFGEPQEPRGRVQAEEVRRKFVHHPMPSSPTPVAGPAPRDEDEDEDAFVAPDLDSEEEDLPEHPIARAIPRERVEEEELSLTQQRLNQEQRIKMLEAELEDIQTGKVKMTRREKEVAMKEKSRKIEEIEIKKAELELAERAYYEGRDEEDEEVDLDADMDETPLDGEDEEQYQEEDEEGYEYAEEEEDQSVEVGTSFPGNNNRMAPPKPWTREDLNQLITCLKFHDLESKYMEAADLLERDLDEVVQTAKEHKEVWAEEYVKKTGEVPEWVRCIGEHVACEME